MKKIKIISVLSIILLILSIIFMFDIIFPFIFQSEKIGLYELKQMAQAKFDINQHFVEINENMKIPLPIGSVKFENENYTFDNQYLVSNKNIKIFLNNREQLLNKYDLIIEQMGSAIIIKSKNENIGYVNISINKYTSNFIRFIINPQ